MSNDQLCWFHGKLTREDAEELIKQGNDDGSFLIRESSSALGDFVLTLFYQGEVWHYQIRRHGEDAFFSIDDQVKILHGLDTLVEFYKQGANGLVTKLTNHIKKDLPPNDSRSHGVTNLLHRATKENNQTVVSELLKCGYRNVDAKNQDGQTAVHLAAQHCDETILKLLLDADVNVNCMDSVGNMPLHYACRDKSASFIQTLIKAGANVQGRNIKNDYVPLHEAAKHGNAAAIMELLTAHAPLLPRTSAGEFPIDLAKEAGHEEVVQLLQNHKLPPPMTFQNKWHHGTLSRDEAISTLKTFAAKVQNGALTPATTPVDDKDCTTATTEAQNSDRSKTEQTADASGCFLVRHSEKHGYVLTLLWSDNVMNFIISQSSKYWYIDNGPYLPSLEHLIEHFMRFSDGLPVNLKHPVPPKPKPPLPLFSTMPRTNHRKNATERSSPIKPESPNYLFKEEQIRKLSLDCEKIKDINNGRAQTLQKKKSKEIATSVFSTLRLRSPKKSIENFRKKSKNTTTTTPTDEEKDPSKDKSQATEALLKNISFSTQFSSSLNDASESPLAPISSSTPLSLVPPDEFYNVPRNNAAVIPPETAAISPTAAANVVGSISELEPLANAMADKTEAEIEYFTKSDIEIEKERMLEPPNSSLPQSGANTGYIQTMDIRVFADPLIGEFTTNNFAKSPTELRNLFKYPQRMESVMSTVSNESEVNRYLNRQQSTTSTSTLTSESRSSIPDYFIAYECLERQSIIGEGEFGSVYKGRLRRLRNPNDPESDAEMYFECAIKTVRDDHHRTKEFLREAAVMISLHHHCIVQLIGISKGETLMMVQELAPLGSMLVYIHNNSAKINPKYELKIWASQIACGMEYLASRHFVHRDLAARNILLASIHQAKISDFGLSRALGPENDCYQASQNGKWPIKWYAPESFNNGLFSHASDVWSFGITLWEMFSLCAPPYGDLRGVEVITLIESGKRLLKPELCPDNVYEIMKNCWNYKAKDRPTFRFLTDFFAKDPDYENIMEMIKTEHID